MKNKCKYLSPIEKCRYEDYASGRTEDSYCKYIHTLGSKKCNVYNPVPIKKK